MSNSISNISRRSAIKSLFIASVVPSILISSCTNSVDSTVESSSKNKKLFKSSFDNEIASLEKMIVKNDAKSNFEIPKNYIYNGRSGLNGNYILVRNDADDISLWFEKVEIIEKKANLVVISGLKDDSIIIANPNIVVKKLHKLNYDELKRKFKMGKQFNKEA